ncbi:MAG: mycothiol synthase [Corynebacterium sp.]|nr:mycothiol synthase [Corynebacterium sp.]
MNLTGILNSDERRSALSIIENAQSHDAIPPFSEQFLLGLDDERLGHRHVLVDGGIAAIAPGGDVELVVDPDVRGQHIGSDLVEATKAAGGTKFWAHGNLPAAKNLAAKNQMKLTRELWVMARPVSSQPAEPAVFPEGMRLLNLRQSIEAFGEGWTMESWLRVNNEAFDWHPEQGHWDMPRLRRALEAEWVKPEGIFLLWEQSQDPDENITARPTLLGFHWTKLEDGVGEIYVVGLANAARGRKLGAPLTEAGIHYMEAILGSGRIDLYVEHDNAPAIRLYEKEGFAVRETHSVYEA